MALFGKKQDEVSEVELFTEEPNERVFEFKKSKTVVRIDDYFIRIARKSNVLLHGLDGEKSILLSEITAYQLKEPGATVGYLQLVYPGSSDTKGGVFDAVKEGDEVAIEVATEMGNYLGHAMADMAAVLDPAVFVIGGGVSKAGEVLLSFIEKPFMEKAFFANKNVKFKLATLGNDAGICGAAKLVLED